MTDLVEHERFQLEADWEPAGDQPQAISGMVEGLNDGLTHQTLLGVTGSGKTFSIANVIAQVQRPALIMAPNKTLAGQLYGEFRDFFPHNAVEYFVSYYDYYQPEAYVPSSDTFIEKDSSVNDHIEQMRLSATKSILTATPSLWRPFPQFTVWVTRKVISRWSSTCAKASAWRSGICWRNSPACNTHAMT